jgi:mannitol-1-phosphate 5-dehydrogenase
MKKLVLFGAGKIGRSFIGQLFSKAGYEVVFIDISETVINELNHRKEYQVVIKSDRPDSVIQINNVRGVLATDSSKVASEVSEADIACISVGQRGLPGAISNLARGLELRRRKYGNLPLDVILAENMHNADEYVGEILGGVMEPGYPVSSLVGLIETSIGKMVPIMPLEVQQKDPLIVYAEPFNTLILDKKAFKNPVPDVKGLAPKENMKAWVDRKSHIHNFGHVAAAFRGFRVYPEIKLLADLLEIKSLKEFTRNSMLQSADILMKKYQGEFTRADLTEHIDDLLNRFCNRSLGDTVFRVGCDLKRKLYRSDRVLGPLIDGIRLNSPVSFILETFINGLEFAATDETGNQFPGDVEFSETLKSNSLENVLYNLCGLDRDKDRDIAEKILEAVDHS